MSQLLSYHLLFLNPPQHLIILPLHNYSVLNTLLLLRNPPRFLLPLLLLDPDSLFHLLLRILHPSTPHNQFLSVSVEILQLHVLSPNQVPIRAAPSTVALVPARSSVVSSSGQTLYSRFLLG